MKTIKNNFAIYFVFISIPIVLLAILQILPTFDDWTTLSMPNYDSDYLTYILPYGMTWRPGDAIWGYINAINYKLYPTHMGRYKKTMLLYF